MARPASSSIAASNAAESLARTRASASARASLTRPATLSWATVSIALRRASIARSSATARRLSPAGPLAAGSPRRLLFALDDLLVVGLDLLLLAFGVAPNPALLSPVLFEDDLLALPWSGKAGGLLQALEPLAQVPVLLLEL